MTILIIIVIVHIVVLTCATVFWSSSTETLSVQQRAVIVLKASGAR